MPVTQISEPEYFTKKEMINEYKKLLTKISNIGPLKTMTITTTLRFFGDDECDYEIRVFSNPDSSGSTVGFYFYQKIQPKQKIQARMNTIIKEISKDNYRQLEILGKYYLVN